MKTLKVKFGLFSLLAILVFIANLHFFSCNLSDEQSILPKEEQSVTPKVIGQIDGLDIYESAEFLGLTDKHEDIQFPVLAETPESEYQLSLEDIYPEEVQLRAATYGIRINNPYIQKAATHEDSQWSAPNHHRRWTGKWATDLWKSNGSTGIDYASTCDKSVFLGVQIYNGGGNHYDEVKGRVADTGFACRSEVVEDGGHMQKIKLYGRKNAAWYYLGWLVFAHLDEASLVYSIGDEFDITTYPYQGYIYLGDVSSNYQTGCGDDCCSQSCHLHFEMQPSGWWPSYHVGSDNSNIEWSDKIWSFYNWF